MAKAAVPGSSEVELSKEKLRLLALYHQYREQEDAIRVARKGVADRLREVDAELHGLDDARTRFAKAEGGEG
jgi:hypothetical protein